MARFNIRGDGGYYVQNVWFKDGITRKCTYQITDEGVQNLKKQGIHPGDTIPRETFFELLENELYTGLGGPGEEVENAAQARQNARRHTHEPQERRQIPSRVTPELLREGRLISFGAFTHGWPGYSMDILRAAYREFEKEHAASLCQQANILIKTKLIEAIIEDDTSVTIFLKK